MAAARVGDDVHLAAGEDERLVARLPLSEHHAAGGVAPLGSFSRELRQGGRLCPLEQGCRLQHLAGAIGRPSVLPRALFKRAAGRGVQSWLPARLQRRAKLTEPEPRSLPNGGGCGSHCTDRLER
jgi:hypothetical protein